MESTFSGIWKLAHFQNSYELPIFGHLNNFRIYLKVTYLLLPQRPEVPKGRKFSKAAFKLCPEYMLDLGSSFWVGVSFVWVDSLIAVNTVLTEQPGSSLV